MKKIENSEQFYEIINDLNNQNLNQALKKTKLISKNYPNENIVSKLFATIYFKLMDWKNAIKYYEKNLIFENEKYKIYTNIGVALFKLGKINKSITTYKKSIIENPNSEMTYNNLALSYIEIGLYEKAYDIFLIMLKINKQNSLATKNIIFLLNFINPKNIKNDFFSEINKKIKELISRVQLQNLHKIESLKTILNESDNIINKYSNDLIYEETQIYRKNSEDLNCKRHFKVFNKFNIIPKFCFSCYKVQINLKNVIDLIKLYFIFDNINLKNNNIRKCVVELRDKVKGNYKGYIYCRELTEAKAIKKELNKILIEEKLNKFKIEIKHGCTEYYKSYPKYKKINFEGHQEFYYNQDWQDKEDLIDQLEPARSKINKKILVQSAKGISLSDILIIKNWISYAYILGDHSYKEVYKNHVDETFLKNILKNQINFRIKELKN